MKKKELFILGLGGLLVTVLAFLTGDAGVMLAVAPMAVLEGGGVSDSGGSNEQVRSAGAEPTVETETGGIATETHGREVSEDNDNAEYYSKQIDELITKIRPMSTPIDQMSRYASKVHSDSFVVKYYSVGTRPIVSTVASALAKSTTTSAVLQVADPGIFTEDDTIRVVGVKGYYLSGGQAVQYADGEGNPDLMLCVCGRNTADQMPIVFAVNGELVNGQQIGIPAIESGTKLIRMGKACGELDMQTGRFDNVPTPSEQYCQNFMTQVEQSTFDKIAAKEVNWNFSDLEEDSIYDMRLTQEATYLFGVKNKIKHVAKKGMLQWFTGGIWYQAGNQNLSVGTAVKDDSGAYAYTTITDEDLVDLSKDLFVGTGVGNKRKILLCGSEFLAALSKIKSEKFRLKDTVENWNLKFKSWQTDFGEILTMHHELFDQFGMAGYAFSLDPEYLKKAVHVNWHRYVLDLKKAGIRNTDAVILQEVCALYLRYPQAHARLKLAGWGEQA